MPTKSRDCAPVWSKAKPLAGTWGGGWSHQKIKLHQLSEMWNWAFGAIPLFRVYCVGRGGGRSLDKVSQFVKGQEQRFQTNKTKRKKQLSLSDIEIHLCSPALRRKELLGEYLVSKFVILLWHQGRKLVFKNHSLGCTSGSCEKCTVHLHICYPSCHFHCVFVSVWLVNSTHHA